MIVTMKRVTLIVQSKDADSEIRQLRSLGVVHVLHQQTPQRRDAVSLQDDLAIVNAAIKIISGKKSPKSFLTKRNDKLQDWRFSAKRIIDLQKRVAQLDEYSRFLQNKIAQWQIWGDFDPGRIEELAKKNIFIRLCQVPVKEISKLPDNVIVKQLSKFAGIVNCVLISREKIDIPFKEIELPKMGLVKMQERLSRDLKVIAGLEEDIIKHLCYYDEFLSVRKTLEKDLELYEVLHGMGEAGSLMYLGGYIPVDKTDNLLGYARKNRLGILISDPSENDLVPTLIRNPRWVSIITPIFKIINIVPGYHEFDISLWFLIFFSIFFGMLIGDAGYGLVFFVLTLIAQNKFGKKQCDQSVFILFYILSACAVIWGVLSGTFFGQEWLSSRVKPVMPALRNENNVKELCFLLGAIHLSIAHIWRAINKWPSLKSLADLGWTFILWCAFFLANTLILEFAFPVFAKWLFILGMILVVFFTNPRRNIIKGIGQGFGNLLLNLVNNFTDIVSYIRLFAVGLATVAIADAFNTMALDLGYGSLLRGIGASLILLFGHALNILLGPMSILVHGVRLNVLEFCNHLDLKWSGFAYKPLTEEGGN